MSIGIEDADFSKYILVCFNLEAMKLSAYYKKHNELVVLAPGFTPERHTKFFYRKDYDDGSFPRELLTTPNVEYGGLAFTNNKYAPLPEEIERCHPDTSLYERMRPAVMAVQSNEKKKIFNNLIEAEHCRISLDGKTIWPDYARQFHFLPTCRNLIIHDFDLGQVKDSFEVVTDILKHARTDGWATKVGMKFPVQVYNGEDLLKWASLNVNSTFYSVQYNGIIDDNAFMEWIGRNRLHAVYKQMDYVVTHPDYTEEEFTTTLINKLFHQTLIARSFRLFYRIKYDEHFFTDKNWCKVLDLMNLYINSLSGEATAKYLQISYDDTMIDYAKGLLPVFKHHNVGPFTLQGLRETFEFVREHNYELFKDFYECSARTLGGTL